MPVKLRIRESVHKFREQYSALSPNTRSVLLFGVGMLLGLVVLGWVLMPVRWNNTYPFDMRPEYQAAYLEMVADSYALNSDLDQAIDRLRSWPPDQIVLFLYQRSQKLDAAGRAAAAERVRILAEAVEDAGINAGTAASAPAIDRETLQLLLYGGLVLLALAVLFVVLKSVYDSRQRRNQTTPVAAEDWPQFAEFVGATSPSPSAAAPPPVAVTRPVPVPPSPAEAEGLDLRTTSASLSPSEPAAQPAPAGSDTIRAAYEAAMRDAGFPAPVAGVVSSGIAAAERVSYSAGIENFNQAFRIEERGELLGEYGVGIGVGSTADENEALTMDVWLFDKSDINSVSGVLMHPEMYANEARRDEFVGGNNVAIPLRAGESFRLNTRTLEVVGKVISVSFGSAQREGVPIRALEIEILGRPLHV